MEPFIASPAKARFNIGSLIGQNLNCCDLKTRVFQNSSRFGSGKIVAIAGGCRIADCED
jgi:hypothetical protein